MSGIACQYEETPKKRGPKSKRSDARNRLSQTRPSILSDHDDSSPLSVITPPLPLSLTTSPAYEGQMLAWEPRVSTRETDPTVSPALNSVDINEKIETIHQNLVRSIEAIDVKDSSWSLDATVRKCVDIYMNVIFGIRPIVSEARIRSNLCLKPPHLTAKLSALSFPSRAMISPDTLVDLEEIRSYTLVCALCAATAYLLSGRDDPPGAVVGPIFLHASREMLHLYEPLDVECPDSSSLVIRMFQAGALHTDGRLHLSWHLFGAALRLGEQMQLEDPRSLQGVDPLEARLRVMAFRTIRISARYHRTLENHPLSICDPPWSSLASSDDDSEIPMMMMMSSSPWDKPPEYESQLLVAFKLFEKIWVTASEILTDLDCFVQLDRRNKSILPTLIESHQNHFLEPYSTFLGLLDDLPVFLHSPESIMQVGNLDKTVTEIQYRQFWVQRANLFVNYHCLRMLILNRFAQYGLTMMIGVQKTDTMIALRKTEIAHDMNVFVTNAPIDSLLVNGEACVSRAHLPETPKARSCCLPLPLTLILSTAKAD
ncbi:hypothetical protein N7540_003236 [Penicillium herquei]|nr:hypothetical protein N7540_003236 [Penicillium herquei]